LRRQAELEQLLAARRAELSRPPPVVNPLRSTPVTFVVIVLCGMVAAATDFGADRDSRGWLMLSQWRTTSGLLQTPLLEVRAGELWRLLTPCFLHFGLVHLLGNVGWLYVLGRQMESALGVWRYAMLLVLLGAASNLAQGLLSGPNFGGLSGVVCGVFGYVWFKSRYAPQEGYTLPTESAVLFLGWVVLCLTGVVGPIANVAHLSGLVLGVLLALPRVSAAVE
jgi:GlpG protein